MKERKKTPTKIWEKNTNLSSIKRENLNSNIVYKSVSLNNLGFMGFGKKWWEQEVDIFDKK